MSGTAAKPASRRHRRGADLIATLVIGVVVVAAALLPAVTANSGETTTISGDVTLSGKALAFFPVGFWTTGDGVVSTTSTDADGRFTLEVSATLDGYAYAGTAPDSRRAIIDADGLRVVRGVIGGDAQGDKTSLIYQSHSTATGHGLDNSASQLHFALQAAGTITGTSPVPADRLQAVQIRRADNSVVQTLQLDSRARFRSMPLVPGQYGVVLVPKSPDLPTVANAIVPNGGTTNVTLPTPVEGASVTGTVRTTTGDVGQGVPVLLEQDDQVLASTTTTGAGDWSFAGVAAGDYSVEVGRFDEPAASGASTIEVPIPGATSTPTPTASTASPTPTPTATGAAPDSTAIEPVARTSDAVLPESFDVSVPAVLGEVSVATDVEPAGRISGTVSQPDLLSGSRPSAARVVVEEAATGRIVRASAVGSDGQYSVGGLIPGQRYRVWAVTQPDDLTLAQMGDVSAVAGVIAENADVAVTQPALTLTGTVADATGGKVVAGDAALLQRTSALDSSGAYALLGLVPGAYPVVVAATGRVAAQPVGVVASAAQPVVDLQAGPQPAVFKGWFIAGGAGVPAVTGAAVDSTGETVRFGPETDAGHVVVSGITPGTYEYEADSFRGTVPAVDGPWYYSPPTGSFSLSGGTTPNDVGPILLYVHLH